ncbi:MAG: nitroreductase family protein [Dehalococcoidaceae bacterium]|nr:nitroreductase family protein [Dehalococcoidaceae bacterium]
MDILQIIASRRAIRRYSQFKVEPEKLYQVLEAARWAPSWKNSQCARVVIVEDTEIKKRIAEALKGNRSYDGALEAPVILVICAEKGLSGYSGSSPVTDKAEWFMFDTGVYAQNLMLAAHQLGLGTVIIGYFDSNLVAREICLPQDYAAVALLLLGYPAEQPRSTPRKPLEATVFLNRFGEPYPL